MCVYRLCVLPWDFLAVVCCVKGLLHFLCWQQMEEIWREMRWIMDVLQHARYKQPSCGISLSGFLSEAGGTVKEKTRSSSSHLDYLPSPALSPETSRKLNSGRDPSSCLGAQGHRARWVAVPGVPAGPEPWARRADPPCLCRASASGVSQGVNPRGFPGFHLSGGFHTQAEPLFAALPLADSHGLSDEEGSSEVFLATDSDYDSSRAQSPKELDLVCSTSGPECCSRRAARTLRDSAPDVLQSHEVQTPPAVPPPPEEPRPPAKLYDSDFVLPSRQIELLRITEKRQAYCVRTSSLDFPKPHCPAPRKSCPGSVDSSPAESRSTGPCGQLRLGPGSTASPERRRGQPGSEEWTQDLPEQQPEQPGGLADQGKKLGSVTLRVCPQYETGLSKETSVKVPEPVTGGRAALPCPEGQGWQDGDRGSGAPVPHTWHCPLHPSPSQG